MPFRSQRQLATCYSKKISTESKGRKWTWDCDEWLQSTPDPGCLPSLKGYPPKRKCRNIRNGEKIVGPVYKGPRGGYYFFAGGVKVYVPKGDSNIAYAKKLYGYGGEK